MTNTKNEILRQVKNIQRSQALLDKLYQSGKKHKIKRTAGKMIIAERKNIQILKTNLVLLGTTYEREIEIVFKADRFKIRHPQSGKTSKMIYDELKFFNDTQA